MSKNNGKLGKVKILQSQICRNMKKIKKNIWHRCKQKQMIREINRVNFIVVFATYIQH
jgi:hypothetical protein